MTDKIENTALWVFPDDFSSMPVHKSDLTRRQRVERVQRQALCQRLRETGLQPKDGCDGDAVQCGICQRTIEKINAAARALGG